MKLRRVHSWLLTSCVLLAAAPSYAQYGQSGRVSNYPVMSSEAFPGGAYLPATGQANMPSAVYPNSAVTNAYPVQRDPNPPAYGNVAPPYGNAAVYPAPAARPSIGAWSPQTVSAFQPQPQPAAPSHSDVPSPRAAAPYWPNQPQPGLPNHGSIASPGIGAAGQSHAGNHNPFDNHASHGKATQPWNQSAPCSTCGDFACGGAGCGGSGGGICGPNNGLYFQYDRVYWSISSPETTDIGHAPSERFVTTPAGITLFYQNDLDTSFLDSDFSTGDRFDFGYLNGNWGWAASILHVQQGQGVNATGVSYVPFDPDGLMAGYSDANGDTFDDDIDFDNLFGRNGEDLGTPDGAGGFIAPFDGIPDTPAPADTGDLVTYLVTFGSMSAQNSTEMTGAELMNIYRTAGSNGNNTLDWYFGTRFLQIRDRFMISASGGFLDTMSLDTDVDNNIVGPQVGVRWAHRMGSLVMSVEGRCLLGCNFQRSEQSGHVARNASPGGQNAPVSLTAHSTSRAVTDEQFAPLGELRLDMAYKINRCAAFRFGYTALVTSGIGRASEQVVYRLPDFGLNTSGNNNQTLFSNALTFGVELNR